MAALLNTAGAAPAPAPAKPSALADWISHLRILMPPEGLIHVGAGNGIDLPDYAQWGISQVVLVEADEANAKRLSELARPYAGWQVHHALVAETDGEATFHVASNPRESGLIPANELRPLWRNLQATGQLPMKAVRLDGLMSADRAANINWLVIDCLPAAALLRGAPQMMNHCDVVLARIAMLADDTGGLSADSSIAEFTALLHEQGFQQVASAEERMPMLAQVLFVRMRGSVSRASAAALEKSLTDIEQLEQQLAGLRQQLAQSESDNGGLRQTQAQLENEIEGLRGSIAQSASEVTALRAAVNDRDGLIQDLAATRGQLSALQQIAANDANSNALEQSKLQAALDAMEFQVARCQNQLTNVEAERQQLIATGNEAATRLTQLQSDMDELYRQKLGAEQAALAQVALVEQRQTELETLRNQIASVNLECQSLRVLIQEHEAKEGALEEARHAVEASLALTSNHVQHVEADRDRIAAQLSTRAVQLAERDGQVARLTEEIANLSCRLQESQRQVSGAEKSRRHFDIEMAKAEAQIGLIRDVLLRKSESNQSASNE